MTVTGSPASSPARGAGSSLTWNSVTGAGPGARTIRCAKDTGLRNLPLHGYAHNQIRCEIAALACELPAWTQMLAFTGETRRWEPQTTALRIFTCAGRIVRGGRRLRLRLAVSWPWTPEITTAITRLQALAPS